MTEAKMKNAIAYFGVELTPAIMSLIATVNLYHHDRVMLSREIEPLRDMCGELAILKVLEVSK